MKYLETDRLIIRIPKEEDFETFYAIHADPQTNRYNPAGPVKSRQDFRLTFDAWLAHHEAYGFGYYALIDKRDGQLFGICGLQQKSLMNQAMLNIYYRISPKKTRQGLVKEAGIAIIEALDTAGKLTHPLMILTLVENIPSCKTALALGFTYDPSWDNYNGPGNVYYFKPLTKDE